MKILKCLEEDGWVFFLMIVVELGILNMMVY